MGEWLCGLLVVKGCSWYLQHLCASGSLPQMSNGMWCAEANELVMEACLGQGGEGRGKNGEGGGKGQGRGID